MNIKKTLNPFSFLPHQKPKKLIFMLHGYGDTANNFINIANFIDQPEWGANYIALNAPSLVPNYPLGKQWFDLYPNGVYITEAGPKEISIIRSQIVSSLKLIENSIMEFKDIYKLMYKDCFIVGFSQGGMMTFEFGNYFKNILGGLAILSGRIISEDIAYNNSLFNTPIFISHGKKDEVLPIKFFNEACSYLKKNKLLFEHHILDGDTHTISSEAIKLLQNFIKKNL
jgi:phospholipase/carboxylesterase